MSAASLDKTLTAIEQSTYLTEDDVTAKQRQVVAGLDQQLGNLQGEILNAERAISKAEVEAGAAAKAGVAFNAGAIERGLADLSALNVRARVVRRSMETETQKLQALEREQRTRLSDKLEPLMHEALTLLDEQVQALMVADSRVRKLHDIAQACGLNPAGLCFASPDRVSAWRSRLVFAGYLQPEAISRVA